MDIKSDILSTNGQVVSFVRGGPFFRAQQALGLVRPDQWNVVRRIGALIVIGWLPLLLVTLFSNPRGLPSFITAYRIHARMLVVVPALLLGEIFMESPFGAVLAHLRRAGVLEAPDMAYMDAVLARLVRLRDAFFPELAVLVLLIVHTATSYRGLVDLDPTAWLGQGAGADLRLTAAGWYAVLISAPLFQFLLGLGLWKWLLWTFFAFNLSKRNLKLVATHPDEHGGLGFLGLTASAFAPVAFTATIVIGATWRHDILHHGARLMDYRLPSIVLVLTIAAIALGPLLFFVPGLMALRRTAILEYGILSQIQSTEFHDKWILHRAGHESEFLQATESTTLANFGNAYKKIAELNPFPADTGSLYVLAAAVAIPALPVILAVVPLSVVLKDLFHALR